jgi:hypothetical protein
MLEEIIVIVVALTMIPSSSAESMSDIPAPLMFSKHYYPALQAVTVNICRELSMRAGQAGSQSICRSSIISLLDSFSQFCLISNFSHSFRALFCNEIL